MKIKRFVAETMRDALAQVREEQGPDAVILSNRRIDGGIELITAVDYDETLIEEALKRSRPASEPAAVAPATRGLEPAAAAPRGLDLGAAATNSLPGATETLLAAAAAKAALGPASATPAKSGAGFRAELDRLMADEAARARAAQEQVAQERAAAAKAKPAPKGRRAIAGPEDEPAPAGPRLAWSQDPELASMRREVETLRQLLQEQLASLAWSDQLRREPARASALRGLTELGLAPDVARTLAERVPAGTPTADAWRIPLALLLKHLPTVDDGLLERGGTFAVVGPTGVGKTTTIAKLAALYALQHGAHRVALVSLDHYRIGARDQLLAYARILGVPMHVATSARELGGVLSGLADRGLVLIDTAGLSPADDRFAAQFATLAVANHRVRTILALAANADTRALDGIVRAYAPIRPESIALTKLDEAASLGPALGVAIRHAVPLARLCDGQRVPEDVHAAHPMRVWLVKQAHKLAEEGKALAGVDDGYMAEHFGRVATNV